MARTYNQQLDAVDAMIEAIEADGMASFTYAGRTVTRQNLDILYRERSRLNALAVREARGGGMRQRSGVAYRD